MGGTVAVSLPVEHLPYIVTSSTKVKLLLTLFFKSTSLTAVAKEGTRWNDNSLPSFSEDE